MLKHIVFYGIPHQVTKRQLDTFDRLYGMGGPASPTVPRNSILEKDFECPVCYEVLFSFSFFAMRYFFLSFLLGREQFVWQYVQLRWCPHRVESSSAAMVIWSANNANRGRRFDPVPPAGSSVICKWARWHLQYSHLGCLLDPPLSWETFHWRSWRRPILKGDLLQSMKKRFPMSPRCPKSPISSSHLFAPAFALEAASRGSSRFDPLYFVADCDLSIWWPFGTSCSMKMNLRRSSVSRQQTISQGSPSWPHDDMDSRLHIAQNFVSIQSFFFRIFDWWDNKWETNCGKTNYLVATNLNIQISQ